MGSIIIKFCRLRGTGQGYGEGGRLRFSVVGGRLSVGRGATIQLVTVNLLMSTVQTESFSVLFVFVAIPTSWIVNTMSSISLAEKSHNFRIFRNTKLIFCREQSIGTVTQENFFNHLVLALLVAPLIWFWVVLALNNPDI